MRRNCGSRARRTTPSASSGWSKRASARSPGGRAPLDDGDEADALDAGRAARGGARRDGAASAAGLERRARRRAGAPRRRRRARPTAATGRRRDGARPSRRRSGQTRNEAPPPAEARDATNDDGRLATFSARLGDLAAATDATFRDLAAWRAVLDLADALSLAEREAARGELAALLAERLPEPARDAPRLDADLLALVDRLDQDFDLARVANDAKRLPEGPRRARLADWLAACAAERAMAKRRAGGRAAYRLADGLPLIPPEDRQPALARADLIAIYEAQARGEKLDLRRAWRGAWTAALFPGVISAARDAPLLALAALGLEAAAFVFAVAAGAHIFEAGADAIGRVETAAALAILVAARLAAMSLWPFFAVRRAAARVRRADRAGYSTPAGRRPILSRRLGAHPFFGVLAVLAGFVDLTTASARSASSSPPSTLPNERASPIYLTGILCMKYNRLDLFRTICYQPLIADKFVSDATWIAARRVAPADFGRSLVRRRGTFV